ncbi:unnamed protein product [Ixodes pacificus]
MTMHARGFVRLRRCETSTVRLNSRRGGVGEPGTIARTPTLITATSFLYPCHCHRHQHLPRRCIKLLKSRVIFLVQRIMMSNRQLSHGWPIQMRDWTKQLKKLVCLCHQADCLMSSASKYSSREVGVISLLLAKCRSKQL